jgi:arsenate reductase
MPRRYKVAFICIKNSCRSQMAEAFARELASDVIEPYSGGTEPSARLDPGAVDAMREVGIDISGARPKLLPKETLYSLDLVVHMGCGSEQCLAVPGVPSEEWGIEDPAAKGPEKYREIRELIRTKVLDLAGRLRSMGVAPRSASGPDRLRLELV